MGSVDRLTERASRAIARRLSRRSFVAGAGQWLVGAALLPLLPVARGARASDADPGDPSQCDYWRYCGIDGFLCSCCGGSANACPPGTTVSAITWIGTCLNPADGKHYVISYNDCCGKGSCGRCLCNRNEGDTPLHSPQRSNDYNWCSGSSAGIAYNCSTAFIKGVASES